MYFFFHSFSFSSAELNVRKWKVNIHNTIRKLSFICCWRIKERSKLDGSTRGRGRKTGKKQHTKFTMATERRCFFIVIFHAGSLHPAFLSHTHIRSLFFLVEYYLWPAAVQRNDPMTPAMEKSVTFPVFFFLSPCFRSLSTKLHVCMTFLYETCDEIVVAYFRKYLIN